MKKCPRKLTKNEGYVLDDAWLLFLRGLPPLEKERPPVPAGRDWLTEEVWVKILDLENEQPDEFAGLSKDIIRTPIYLALGQNELRLNPTAEEFDGYEYPEPPENQDEADLIGNWNSRLTSFAKLMLIKLFAEERVITAIQDFVILNIGKQFVENPPVAISDLYESMTEKSPLVFVLSTGSDPMGAFQRFAADFDYLDKGMVLEK